jgi:PPM family protein phosphatase
MDLAIAHLSDVGRVRSGNEDSVLSARKPDSPRGHLLVVADGMGGAEAGEVASRMAVEALAEVYLSDKNGPPANLRRGMAEANARIHFAGQERAETCGMGTTCTALAVREDRIFVAHVGDSRAYRVRAGVLERLTNDHSVWAEHVRSGDQRFSPAITSGRNQLTRALGIDPQVAADITETDLRPGDLLLLCSDGLWSLVTDPEILRIVRSGTPEESCRRLVELANDRGGHDNVSVVVAEAQE